MCQLMGDDVGMQVGVGGQVTRISGKVQGHLLHRWRAAGRGGCGGSGVE